MSWLWDDFETYRLRQSDLDDYLVKLHGNWQFYFRVDNGFYQFWVPRKLSAEERREVEDLRYEDV
ncbi:hypothetical protein EJ04DRAFT_563673 [Polyplosphaeria fusca]|uniref:Uncharacterized protein n=1 Tax=Polyplosphaeria fusca TaxID=682080 RepID=A0A9P4QYX1_9PLEO|nr:hypothetical protein EJ04DRAFT_563673 [Polyplosphaeria fusca]